MIMASGKSMFFALFIVVGGGGGGGERYYLHLVNALLVAIPVRCCVLPKQFLAVLYS